MTIIWVLCYYKSKTKHIQIQLAADPVFYAAKRLDTTHKNGLDGIWAVLPLCFYMKESHFLRKDLQTRRLNIALSQKKNLKSSIKVSPKSEFWLSSITSQGSIMTSSRLCATPTNTGSKLLRIEAGHWKKYRSVLYPGTMVERGAQGTKIWNL